MVPLQVALIERLLQHRLTLAGVLQIRFCSIGSRASATYRAVSTTVVNHCVNADLPCDQAPRKLGADHERRVGAGLSAWRPRGTGAGLRRSGVDAQGRLPGFPVFPVVPRGVWHASGTSAGGRVSGFRAANSKRRQPEARRKCGDLPCVYICFYGGRF